MAVCHQTLILDFYDSYTRNILSVFEKAYGTDPEWQAKVVIVNIDDVNTEGALTAKLHELGIECLILGPGPGSPHNPSDFSYVANLIGDYAATIPMLGLCLGHQGIAASFGGRIAPLSEPKHGHVTTVRHTGDDVLFDGIPQLFQATQYNSLGVERAAFPHSELEIIASDSVDPQQILAIRHKKLPIRGVQFHFESITSTYGVDILRNFNKLVSSFYTTHPKAFGNISMDKFDSPEVFKTGNGNLAKNGTVLPRRVLTTNGIHATSENHLLNDIRPSTQEKINHEATQERKTSWTITAITLDNPHQLSSADMYAYFSDKYARKFSFWLDSARPNADHRYSHMCYGSSGVLTEHYMGKQSSNGRSYVKRSFTENMASDLAFIKEHTCLEPGVTLPCDPPLGYVGYLGYEMNADCLGYQHEKRENPTSFPDALFGFVDCVLSYDYLSDSWIVSGLVKDETYNLGDHYTQCGCTKEDWLAFVADLSEVIGSGKMNYKPTPPVIFANNNLDLDAGIVTCRDTKEAYIKSIQEAQARIHEGDSYELCLTTQFEVDLNKIRREESICTEINGDSVSQSPLNPLQLYFKLRKANPAPYSAFMHFKSHDFSILSSSPECFMRIDASGSCTMKPIKGTAARCLDNPEKDEEMKETLRTDLKERAENLMIVDLSRNDLLGFCEVASVHVPKLMDIESYETVHQMVTTVKGQLLPAKARHPFSAIAGCFPPGSMTGAPKLRSVQILNELEQQQPRSIYSGTLGYSSVLGTSDFSVVIRTLFFDNKLQKVTLNAGGAITYLSDAESEWEEVLVKARAVLRCFRD